MDYHITRKETYSLGTVPAGGCGVAIAHITVDTHHENSLLGQAIHHLYPEALLSGAGKLSREAFLNAVNLLGADISTTVTEGRLTITLRATSAAFPKLLKLTEVMLTEPTFAAFELKRIRTTVANELHTKQEMSSVIAREQLRNCFYEPTDRRYSADSVSLSKYLSEVDVKTLRTYHEGVLKTNWTCSIAADKSLVTAFTKLVEKLKKHRTPTHNAGRHAQKVIKRELSLKDIPSKANIDFSIGVPVPITIHHPDYVPMTFALGVLGIPGFAGRLMNTVRDKDGLTYMIYAYAESFSGTEQGYARIATFFAPEKCLQGLNSTFREIKKFFRGGITQAEFDTFQTIFKTKQALLQDSLMKQLSDLHAFNQNGFTVDEIHTFKARLNTITRAQVNEAIKKYFNPLSFTISGAGPVTAVQKDIQVFIDSMA